MPSQPQGVDLDPQSLEMLRRLEADPFLDPSMSPPEMRHAFDAFYAKVDMAKVDVQAEDSTFSGPAGDVPVRVYKPRGAGAALPVTLFYKGGGLIMGTLNSYDAIARRLCRSSGGVVVSVAYRQPPEHKFPAAVDDCRAALDWAHTNAATIGGDASCLAVAGDSGGGTLAAAVANLAHDDGGPRLAAQTLVYPAVGRMPGSASMLAFAKGFWFEPEALDWLYSQYASPSDLDDPRVQPLLRRDFSGLPPAFIVVAEHDILRDAILSYASRLEAAGVETEVGRYGRTIHGFLNMGGVIDYAAEAVDRCGAFLARRFAAAA